MPEENEQEIRSNKLPPSLQWDLSRDVIIIGSGFAGLAAAIECAEAGADVIVLEKMAAAGGNSTISDGGIAAPNTALQAKYGLEDSTDLMYRDMMKAGMGLGYHELVRTVVDKAKDAFEWTVNDLGVDYLDRVDIFGGHSVARCYTAKHVSGATIIKQLLAKLKTLGVEIKFKTAFKTFVQTTDQAVCGIIATQNYVYNKPNSGEDIAIRAKKGVILASGGYGADINFREIQDPRLNSSIDTTNMKYTSGYALKEALRIGAAPVQLSQIQLGPWACPDEKGYGIGPQFSEYVVFQYGMMIDPCTGRRFVNELADRKTLSDKMLSIGRPVIGIADTHGLSVSGWNIEKCLKRKIVRMYDSIEKLAACYGVDYNRLSETIHAFNRSIAAGRDNEYGKPVLKAAKPLQTPPFYAIRLWPKVHYTMGGLRINKEAHVLDFDGNIIKGLFAAGEVTGGIHGACRLGSCAITECLVFGRIAGRKASQKP